MKIIRRRKPGDDPDLPTPKGPEEWIEIHEYPNLEAENIRGVRVFRTKYSPLKYRVVISAFVEGAYRIPAVVAIANERRIRFGEVPVEFGVIQPGERKVSSWLRSLPEFRNRDVVLSNPDFVELSTTTLAELTSTNSTTGDS
jgi:hypothetical protein